MIVKMMTSAIGGGRFLLFVLLATIGTYSRAGDGVNVASSLKLYRSQHAQFPGRYPGNAEGTKTGGVYTLENDVISASWSLDDQGRLVPLTLTDKLRGKSFAQDGCNLFRLSTLALPYREDTVFLGIRITKDTFEVMVSMDNTHWEVYADVSRKAFKGMPNVLRVGKMSSRAGTFKASEKDRILDAWIDNVCIKNSKNEVLFQDRFDQAIGRNGWTPKMLKQKGSALESENGVLAIRTLRSAHGYVERSVPTDAAFVSVEAYMSPDNPPNSCPSIALVWPDGNYVLAGTRQSLVAVSLIANAKPGGNIATIHHPIANGLGDYNLTAKDFQLVGRPRIVTEKPNPGAGTADVGNRFASRCIVAEFINKKEGLKATWKARLRDASSYIQSEVIFEQIGEADKTVTAVEILNCRIGDATRVGNVTGSPLASECFFAGMELPTATNYQIDDVIRCSAVGNFWAAKKYRMKHRGVVGVYQKNQLRRSFLYYIERERARESKPALNYNNWYDTGVKVTEKDMMYLIGKFEENLCKPYDIKMSAYVIDSGWQAPSQGLYVSNKIRFPNGIEGASRRVQETYKSRIGMWLSPNGGYWGRMAHVNQAKALGLLKGNSLDFTERGYYDWFLDKHTELISKHNIAYFKWDSAGPGWGRHYSGMCYLASALRERLPDADYFVIPTWPSWASPFFLNHVDGIWRAGGGDVVWKGVGDKRERWITGRDDICYEITKEVSPLFPMNSIMLHGIVHGKMMQGASVAKAGNDLKNEARSFFAGGSNVQELYLSPDIMNKKAWADVAEAIKWGHENAHILVDSSMFGGRPAKLETYGFSSWTPTGALFMIRNPDQKKRSITLDPAKVFNLPEGAPRTYVCTAAFNDQRISSLKLQAGNPVAVELEPFEVLVFDVGEK